MTGVKSHCLMHSDTLGRCSCDIRADPIKDPNRTDQNSPRKGSKGSCVREGLSKKKVIGTKRITGKERVDEGVRVAEKSEIKQMPQIMT